jgi:DUF1680 family protein
MPNAWRFYGALPEYLFSYDERGLFVNLYSASTVRHALDDGTRIALRIDTDYPHDGTVTIHVENDVPTDFSLRLRIPAWCKGASVQVRGEDPQNADAGSYFTVRRLWQPGDILTLRLPMPVRMIHSDPRIVDNAGQVVFARGPLVYCLEGDDVRFPVERARVAVAPEQVESAVQVQWDADLLGGIYKVCVPGIIAPVSDDRPYFEAASVGEPAQLTLIPFYARANRGDDSRWVTFLPQV